MSEGNHMFANGSGKILITRVIETMVIGSLSIGAGLYVSVNVLGVRLDAVESSVTKLDVKTEALDDSISNLRLETAGLTHSGRANARAMDTATDRIKNIASRVRDLERAVPRSNN